MVTNNKKMELLKSIEYNPSSKANPILVAIRSNPYLYSLIVKARIWFSRNILSKQLIKKFNDNVDIFNLNDNERKHVKELDENGITVLENYFDREQVTEIDNKIDSLFRKLNINMNGGYNVSHGRLKTLKGMSYEELSITEQAITIKDPLLKVPEVIKIAFNESFLKIVSNYFGYVPTHATNISRSFPHIPPIESSYFHKDSIEHEVLHIFIYLVDVDNNGGPFCYIPKTHKNDVESCRAVTSYDLGKKDSYGRISDKEIKKSYPETEWMPINAKKGSVVIVNVNGFHKGPMWIGNDINQLRARDVLQINFRSINKNRKLRTKSGKLFSKDIKNFTNIQKLFLDNYEIIED